MLPEHCLHLATFSYLLSLLFFLLLIFLVFHTRASMYGKSCIRLVWAGFPMKWSSRGCSLSWCQSGVHVVNMMSYAKQFYCYCIIISFLKTYIQYIRRYLHTVMWIQYLYYKQSKFIFEKLRCCANQPLGDHNEVLGIAFNNFIYLTIVLFPFLFKYFYCFASFY